jgi:hypothetical protein
MGHHVRGVPGVHFPLSFFVSEAITAGQVLCRTITAAAAGEVIDPASVNAITLGIGCAMNAVGYDATPSVDPRYGAEPSTTLLATGGPENIVRIMVGASAVWRMPMSGGTASGTALQPSTATPANILTQDAASTTVITDTAVGTIEMIGGLIKGRTGNNKGSIRRISAHADNTSTTVTIAFINSAAVGDTFIRVPWSHAVVEMEMTTDFVEANAIEQTADHGGPVAVINVHIDEERDTGYLDVCFVDNWLSPVAVGADLS